MGKIRLTQIRSTIKRPERQKRTMEALGLRKINQSVEIDASLQVLGMVRRVSHLNEREEIQ